MRLEDVTRVKWMVLQHLPLFQFNKTKSDSDLISSVLTLASSLSLKPRLSAVA